MKQDLRYLIHKSDAVIVYGAGDLGAAVLKWCLENVRNKELFVSVTKRDYGKSRNGLLGIPINEIAELVEWRQRAVVLVSTFSGHFAEIDKVLQYWKFEQVVFIDDWFFEEFCYKKYKELPIAPNKILVENFHGLGYGDNPKYIVEELLKSNANMDIVWIVKAGTSYSFPKGIRTVEINSEEFYEEVSTSAIWLSNVRKHRNIMKRNEQFYIQTWHGFPFKRIEKDAEECAGGASALYFDEGKRDSKMIDLLLSNSTFVTKIFRESFWYEGDVAETGTPRNDIFFRDNKSIVEKVKSFYGIEETTKIVLYAPTFRNNYIKEPYDIDVELILEALKKRFGNEYVCLFRLHPNIVYTADKYKYDSRIINAGFYEDMMELLVASDVLITDYSSSVYDYILTQKKVFIYANDIERYVNEDRGVYISFDELPFQIAQSNEELVSAIMCYDKDVWIKRMNQFCEKMGYCDDGNASKRVAELILKKCSRRCKG